jgi:hypothetical protein
VTVKPISAQIERRPASKGAGADDHDFSVVIGGGLASASKGSPKASAGTPPLAVFRNCVD